MKKALLGHVRQCLETCYTDGTLSSGIVPEIVIEVPTHAEHGDFATNVAMQLAKPEKKAPRQIAEILVNTLKNNSELFEKVEIAGPGFINFFINKSLWRESLKSIVVSRRRLRQGNGGQR